jgi:glycosyltransferase involved in cell wall biosynthesis
MIKVLFAGKFHRVRRRETVLHPPKGVEFVTQQSLDNMGHDYQLSGTTNRIKTFKITKFTDLISYNHFIPKRYLTDINLIYSPGKIILNKFPWVIEIDNVAVLTYYNLGLLKLFRPIIMRYLKSSYCKSIICISNAAKISVVNYFKDPIISKKCVVVYPYVNIPKFKHKTHKNVRLLYISTDFYLKGGKEILHVFEKLSHEYPDLELDVISNTPTDVVKNYSLLKNIHFIPATLEKKEIYEKYYSNADIFLQISYLDSFGLVNLEAVSAGLPIISTDMFAIPEMVYNKKNGFIIHSPVSIFNTDCTPNEKFWKVHLGNYAKTHDFNEVEKDLEAKLRLLITNKNLRKKMSAYSLYLVRTGRFNEKNRLKALSIALGVK